MVNVGRLMVGSIVQHLQEQDQQEQNSQPTAAEAAETRPTGECRPIDNQQPTRPTQRK
jgi:hypothetical protein